jgi:hypothetical protein
MMIRHRLPVPFFFTHQAVRQAGWRNKKSGLPWRESRINGTGLL